MQKILSFLAKLELSPTACKVYLALLELGKASADMLAKRAQTYKANVYQALDRLQEVGLCTSIVEEHRRYFLPTSPLKLPQIIEEMKEKQEKSISELKADVARLMPELNAKFASIKNKELFEIYHGRVAYKALINEIIKEKPQYWKGFGNLQIQEGFPVEFQRWFRKIPISLFSTKTPEVLERLKEAQKITTVNITWIPKEIYMPIVWVVFGSNLLIIIYEPDIVLIRIKSEQIVKTFASQFDYLWKKYNS